MKLLTKMRVSFFTLFICMFNTLAFAKTGYIIINAKIFVGNGDTIDKGTIIIEDEKIVQVTQESIISKPFEVIDVKGSIVTPGFIDSITEVGIVDVSLEDSANDAEQKNIFIDPSLDMSVAVNQNSSVIPITRKEGVTSVIALPHGGFVSGKGVWLDLDSDIRNQPNDFSLLAIAFGKETAESEQYSRAQRVSKFIAMLDDTLWYQKQKKLYLENKSRSLSLSYQQLSAMIPVIEAQSAVLFFVNRASDILNVIKIIEQYHLKAVIAGACEAWMIAENIKQAEIPIIVNPLQNAPDNFSSIGCRDDNAALLAEKGVQVIISTFDTHNSRLLRQYVGNAIRSGLSYQQGLKSITSYPASAFGKKNYGVIQENHIANLVIWTDDPFELSSSAKMVFIKGKLQNVTTRQDRLFDKYYHLYQKKNR